MKSVKKINCKKLSTWNFELSSEYSNTKIEKGIKRMFKLLPKINESISIDHWNLTKKNFVKLMHEWSHLGNNS